MLCRIIRIEAPVKNENVINWDPRNTRKAKSETVYEFEPHANFFLVRRFDLIEKRGAIKCVPSIQLCVLADIKMMWAIALRHALPDKFYFSHLVYHNELCNNIDRMSKIYCYEDASEHRDERLGVKPSEEGFDKSASEFLKERGIDQRGTLVVAPLKWVGGVIKKMKTISTFVEDYAGELGV